MIMKWPIFLVILSTLLTATAQYFYKIGADRLPELWTNWPLAAGFIIYCTAALFIIISLKYADMSVAFPALATSFVWVSLISVFILNEVLSAVNWAGVGLIVAGVALLGGSS